MTRNKLPPVLIALIRLNVAARVSDRRTAEALGVDLGTVRRYRRLWGFAQLTASDGGKRRRGVQRTPPAITASP